MLDVDHRGAAPGPSPRHSRGGNLKFICTVISVSETRARAPDICDLIVVTQPGDPGSTPPAHAGRATASAVPIPSRAMVSDRQRPSRFRKDRSCSRIKVSSISRCWSAVSGRAAQVGTQQASGPAQPLDDWAASPAAHSVEIVHQDDRRKLVGAPFLLFRPAPRTEREPSSSAPSCSLTDSSNKSPRLRIGLRSWDVAGCVARTMATTRTARRRARTVGEDSRPGKRGDHCLSGREPIPSPKRRPAAS